MTIVFTLVGGLVLSVAANFVYSIFNEEMHWAGKGFVTITCLVIAYVFFTWAENGFMADDPCQINAPNGIQIPELVLVHSQLTAYIEATPPTGREITFQWSAKKGMVASEAPVNSNKMDYSAPDAPAQDELSVDMILTGCVAQRATKIISVVLPFTPAPTATRVAEVTQPVATPMPATHTILPSTKTATHTPTATPNLPTSTPTQTAIPPTSTPTRTPTATRIPPTPTLAAGDTRTRARDGMVMVYVPSGTFMMGSENGASDEKPVHQVTLDSFWLDKTEVTNAQFALFLNAEGNQEEGGGTWFVEESWTFIDSGSGRFVTESGYEEHSVVGVTWYGAKSYCEWVGGRLPTEAEWEYAARGRDETVYPWGNTFDGNKLNYCDSQCEYEDWKDNSVNDGYARTAPVGSYLDGASWVGAWDMAGNVWEWVADWYGSYSSGAQTNPTGPSSGTSRVLRGGSWTYNSDDVRSASRHYYFPISRLFNIGYRCVLP